ncbi:hypothetical protein HJC23_009586 [Cyclotella cryptica]|uniref:Fanconi anemia group D2 protein n=1 Tax=Cyclotella cryptica TaxID=29204 RepID=A0ABD3PPU5_9STRA
MSKRSAHESFLQADDDDDVGNASPKRNRTHPSKWGLTEVLAECGCLLRRVGESDDENVPPSIELGCRLESKVTPTTLCSSLNALLNEMASGVDPNNARILGSLEETLSSSLDDESQDNNNNNHAGNTLLRRMLLPMYRLRGDMPLMSQMSQLSQSPTKHNSNHRVKVESYSLIQVLLRIDALQPTLLTNLIQLLPEITSRFDPDTTTHEDIPRLIFSNTRWLDHILDADALTACFSECLTVLASSSASCPKTKGVLLDAISTLPDVLNSSQGGHTVLATLQMLRVEDPTLLVPCLDAIDSLPLSEKEVEIVVRDALEALANVEAWGLPALANFLINNCPRGKDGMAKEIIEEFRKLPLGSGESGDRSANDTEALMVESLSRGFAHRSDLTTTLLKAIKATDQGYHKPADIWLLACCASASHNRSQVKSLFRSKANDGGFTSQMVRESLCGNGVALTSLFGTALCDLADSLLRCTDSEGCEMGVTLYEVLFEEFKEPMQRQEVVGSLVTHVGAGVGTRQSEVDAAMSVFSSIVSKKKDENQESGRSALRPFMPFLSSMLENLDHMTPYQVRKLFILLFTVGFQEEDGILGLMGGGSACGEADIIIRKYLCQNDYEKKRIGIIGAVSYAVSMSSLLLDRHHQINGMIDSATCLPSIAAPTSPCPIKGMIEFALANCKPSRSTTSIQTSDVRSLGNSFSDSCAMAFLLHELGHAVRSGKLLPSLHEWLDEHFQGEFEQRYVGDFVVENSQDMKLVKGGYDQTRSHGGSQQLLPTNANDLSLLNKTSNNALAPPGEVRYGLYGADTEVYIKILPLLSSPCVLERELLPVQLCPMFSLMAMLSDARNGGKGLSEIDALLECPLILPSTECSGVEFNDLSISQQWVTTSSYYFATCWVRELINAFIHAETSTPSLDRGNNRSTSESSQGFHADTKKRIVDRLSNLVELEEELRFTSSKCYAFAPPGLDVLTPPKELFESDIDNDTISASVLSNVDPNEMIETAARKATKDAKKMEAKRAKQNEKSKQKRLSLKAKYERTLADRALLQLRPLDPAVCIALGFPELSVMGESSGGTQQLSALGLSQLHAPNVARPVTLLLLNLLNSTLSSLLSNRRGAPFKMGNDTRPNEANNNNSNPYGMEQAIRMTKEFVLSSCDVSQRECLKTMILFLEGDVFSSVFEHLAALAQLRGNAQSCDESTEQLIITTARSLFSCVTTIVGSTKLTRSSTGKKIFAAILKALSEGDKGDERPRQVSADIVVKFLSNLFDIIQEIVTGSYTDDIDFVMDGVLCMATICDCSRRFEMDKPDYLGKDKKVNQDSNEIKKKLADVTDSLLRRGWPDDVKLNRNNVGKMLSLLLENSQTAIPTSTKAAIQTDSGGIGRMSILRLLINDVLSELPNTDKCKGPELASLFESSLGKTKDPSGAKKVLELLTELVSMMQSLFYLTRRNDVLAKKHPLLQQLKWGSRFIETFVSKAIPFFHVHFQDHQDSILIIIGDLQKASRQLYHIIAYGKRVKDANLAKETPRTKKALELFIHKVKALLKKNRCLTAMWTKTLKSKDIDGTTLREEKESAPDEGLSENEEEEDEDDDSSVGSSEGYVTDDQSVEE